VPPPPRTALISCLRLLGDVVLSLPLLDMIKAQHPGCEVDFLVPAGAASLLAPDPRIRRIIEHARGGPPYLPKILMRYDWAISTNGSDRGVISAMLAGRRRRAALVDPCLPMGKRWQRVVLTDPVPMPQDRPVVHWTVVLAESLGMRPQRCMATLHWTADDMAQVHGTLAQAGIEPSRLAVLHGMSRYRYKKWPIDRLAALSDALTERHGLQCVWTGAASDTPRLAEGARMARHTPVLAAGTLSLPQVSALLSLARVYVGVDTAITHIAAAVGTPMVALFGPTPARAWAPWNNAQPTTFTFPREPGSFRNGHISLLQDAEVFRREHHYGAMDMHSMSQGMQAIRVEQVLAEVDHQLGQARAATPQTAAIT
jgi:heptosyltransferase-3